MQNEVLGGILPHLKQINKQYFHNVKEDALAI